MVFCPTEPSKDIRFRVLEAAAPGNANSPSNAGLGRGVLVDRCDSVDFLKDVPLRRGDCALTTGEEKENPPNDSLSFVRCGSCTEARDAFGWSKMLSKSFPRLEIPCKLRLFATGLLPVSSPKFMTPSLRLSGLDFLGDTSVRRVISNLMGLSFKPYLSVSMMSGSSTLERGAGVFSCPVARRAIKGVEFPMSVESARTRWGLLDLLVRVRGDERKGAARRIVNFFLAGTVCANGDSGYAAMGLVGPCCLLGLKARVRASGEMGERGESELRIWKREGLEGERERERRSCCRCEKWVPSRR